jgi:hypothetical protein
VDAERRTSRHDGCVQGCRQPRYLGLVAVQGPVCSIELTKAIRSPAAACSDYSWISSSFSPQLGSVTCPLAVL